MHDRDPLLDARDQRVTTVVRVLWVVSGLGIVSALPASWVDDPARPVAIVALGAVVASWVAYSAVRILAIAGYTDQARALLFGTWVAYLFVHLGGYRPGLGHEHLGILIVGLANAFTGMALVGFQVLGTRGTTRWWSAAALLAYAAGAGLAASRLEDADARHLWISTTGLSTLLLGSAAAFSELFARDLATAVSEARALRTELERAAAEAQRASAAKSRFLADMSHELRTPLTGILGYVELLLETSEATRGEVEQDLEHVRQAALHLNTIVGDVLDLAKIEAGKLTVDVRPTPLLPLLEEVTATARPMAAQRHNELVVTTNQVPDVVSADGGRLRQVLLNLLSNATKFTEGGSISVLVEGVEDGARILVSDTGIGIPPEKLGTIFEPFEQVDPSTSKRYGGTGLGLAISRRILQLMGSELTVTSRPGEGSTFTFVLPRATEVNAA
jgi:signal transduction histidine kinase